MMIISPSFGTGIPIFYRNSILIFWLWATGKFYARFWAYYWNSVAPVLLLAFSVLNVLGLSNSLDVFCWSWVTDLSRVVLSLSLHERLDFYLLIIDYLPLFLHLKNWLFCSLSVLYRFWIKCLLMFLREADLADFDFSFAIEDCEACLFGSPRGIGSILWSFS